VEQIAAEHHARFAQLPEGDRHRHRLVLLKLPGPNPKIRRKVYEPAQPFPAPVPAGVSRSFCPS